MTVVQEYIAIDVINKVYAMKENYLLHYLKSKDLDELLSVDRKLSLNRMFPNVMNVTPNNRGLTENLVCR